MAQVRGMTVGSRDARFGYMGAGTTIDAEASRKRIEFDAVSVSATDTTTSTAGLVKSYETLDEKKLEDGTWQVKLKVMVHDFVARGEMKRPKIALMPLNTLKASYYFLGLEVPAEPMCVLMSNQIAKGLTETNKFAVLDRDNIIVFMKEKSFLVNTDAPLSEYARLGSTVGADYLMVGTINDAYIIKQDNYNQSVGVSMPEYQARVSLDYRVISSSSKQIVFAGTCEKNLESDQVRVLAVEQDPAKWVPARMRDNLITIVANDVVQTMLDRLYPIRIAAVENGQIILSQGGAKMAAGMLLDVFSEGRETFDPDTRESLGRIEAKVATIRVKSVSAKTSIAETVEGDGSKLAVGLICRVKAAAQQAPVGAKPDVTRTPSGGVVLPFDKKN